MLVNGKNIGTISRPRGQAFSYVSQAFTNKFFNMDRILFNMSPYITDEESWLIVEEMEKRSQSKWEGNWTTGDCIMFLRELLGNERYNAMEIMWEMDNQQAIQQYNNPEDLRDAWLHKITLTEGTPEQVDARPEDYVRIKTTKG